MFVEEISDEVVEQQQYLQVVIDGSEAKILAEIDPIELYYDLSSLLEDERLLIKTTFPTTGCVVVNDAMITSVVFLRPHWNQVCTCVATDREWIPIYTFSHITIL